MKPMFYFACLWALLATSCGDPRLHLPGTVQPVDAVNPFIGTGGHGHTYPGATMPFGLVQLSPDTRLEGWDGCGGYHYSDSVIYGFSHTHLQGTGVPDYCDILFQPGNGHPHRSNKWKTAIASEFSHDRESAHPGYYGVHLDDFDIEVELTATEHVGIHHYTCSAKDTMQVFIDMAHRDGLEYYDIQTVGDSVVYGYRVSKGWAAKQYTFFYAVFSRPFTSFDQLNDAYTEINPQTGMRTDFMEMIQTFRLGFGPGTDLTVKVGISGVDVDGAKNNLYSEAPHWDFNQYKVNAKNVWASTLAKASNQTNDPNEASVYYTALYHCYTVPNIWSDADSRYRGEDDSIHVAIGYKRYTVFSLWDTFRGYHPLMAELEPDRTRDWITSFLEIYKERGELPVWELAANETYCMIGYHSVPVIADAYMRGVRGFDTELALKAMVAAAEGPQDEKAAYETMGYVPGDRFSESVSKTLEFAYDDWCIAQFAKAIGHDDVYKRFIKRAQNWKNVFDPVTGFMRPRRNGGFPEPFDPYQVDFNYTEANSWQYSFFVPQDLATLEDYFGGKDSLCHRLDQLFSASTEITGREQSDITGLIGQYAHGNEPSHHTAYIYRLCNPEKAEVMAAQIRKSLYTNAPDGLCGNEDCGQMSAWYVLSKMGKYPICPASKEQASMGCSMQGERIVDELITPNPIIQGPSTSFTNSTTISLLCASKDAVINVVLEADRKRQEFVYMHPFEINESVKITAYAIAPNCAMSKMEVAQFSKRDSNRKMKSISPYSAQYTGGGDDALIDGIKGSDDFRTGQWQGFSPNNLEAVIDRGELKPIQTLALSCYQDIRPWIWLPSKVEFLASLDGENFDLLGSVINPIAADSSGVVLHSFELIPIGHLNTKYRYVKVIAYPAFDIIPSWHLGAGGKPWIFADELEIH